MKSYNPLYEEPVLWLMLMIGMKQTHKAYALWQLLYSGLQSFRPPHTCNSQLLLLLPSFVSKGSCNIKLEQQFVLFFYPPKLHRAKEKT